MKRDVPEVKKDISQPATFGPPVVAPGVTDPAAQKYAKQFEQRRGPPKYGVPVAGGPTPPIPRLDSEPTGMLPMADQANQQRIQQTGPFVGAGSLFQGPPPAPQSGGIFPQQPQQQKPSPTALPPGLMMTDLLPEVARKDAAFRDGHGSMYAVSQPALAYKYGVVRNKQHVSPQQLASGKSGAAASGLKPETLAGLQAISAANQSPETAEATRTAQAREEDKRIMGEAAAGSAGASGRLGNVTEGPQPEAKPAKSAADLAKNMDDFDFNRLREALMKDIINNDEQREIIEKRLEPLSLDELFTTGSITQNVPILPGKLEATFRSLSAEDDLTLKRLAMKEAKGLEVSDQYLLDKFSLMTIIAGLYAINNNPFPDYRDVQGHFDEELYWAKFHLISRYPFNMLATLGVHHFWFDIRVRKLFVMESLGNG